MRRVEPRAQACGGVAVCGGLSEGSQVDWRAEDWHLLQGPAGPAQNVPWGSRGFTFTFFSDSKGDSILGRDQRCWPQLQGPWLLSLVSVRCQKNDSLMLEDGTCYVTVESAVPVWARFLIYKRGQASLSSHRCNEGPVSGRE